MALSPHAKPMAENMYRGLWSWIICVAVTVVVSLFTAPKTDTELVGLVYGCTPIPSEQHIAALATADLLGRRRRGRVHRAQRHLLVRIDPS